MWRTALAAVAGSLAGAVLSVLALLLTRWALWRLHKPMEVDHWVIYLAVTLGGGFGGVCGALAGLARASRDRPSG